MQHRVRMNLFSSRLFTFPLGFFFFFCSGVGNCILLFSFDDGLMMGAAQMPKARSLSSPAQRSFHTCYVSYTIVSFPASIPMCTPFVVFLYLWINLFLFLGQEVCSVRPLLFISRFFPRNKITSTHNLFKLSFVRVSTNTERTNSDTQQHSGRSQKEIGHCSRLFLFF